MPNLSRLWAPRGVPKETVDLASEVLQWAQQPYHQRFLEHLKRESEKPIDPRSLSHAELIIGNARANTYREIGAYLRELVQRSNVAIEGPDG